MKINQLKIGTVLSYVSLILGTLVSLLYTPIMLDRLGESEYGVYNLVLPVISYLNLLSFGLGSAYTRYYSRYKAVEDRRGIARLDGMFLVLYTLLGALVLAIGLFLSKRPEAVFGAKLTAEELTLSSRLMVIMTVNAALSFPISVFESHVMVNEQYLFQKIVALGKSVLNPLIMIPLLLMGFRSVAMAVLSLLFTLLSGVLNVSFCLRRLHMPFRFGKFDFPLLREMLGFTSYVFIGILVDQINWSVDRLMLGWMYGTATVTVYTIASQLNIYYMSLSTAFSGILTPKVHRMVASGSSNRELSSLFTRVGRLQFWLMAMVLFGFVAVGRPFVIRWGGGAAFETSYYIALALFIPTLLPAIQTIGIEIQRAKNMHRFRSLVYLGVALCNVAISIPLCMWWQGFGAALGTAISTLLGNCLLMNWYYQKYIGLDIPGFWKSIARMLPGLALPAAAAILIALFAPFQNSYLDVVIWGVPYVLLYVVCMWLFGMNRYEKNLLLDPLRRYVRKKAATERQ